MSKPDISNLQNCVEEVRHAAVNGDKGPADPADYHELRKRLEEARLKLPPLYREKVHKPFVRTLEELGPSGFAEILLRDPQRERAAGLLLDIAQAILQNGERYVESATDAFQEVVSDLYDGFLSAEDRKGIKQPDKSVIAPLVKWGRPEFGPYTWPVDVASHFGLETGIVSLPPAHAAGGLLAWAALGHETAGHDILHADAGLLDELADVVYHALKECQGWPGMPGYWAERMDESASDVLGILNMGPAAGIGLIGYFRALNDVYRGEPKLRNAGSGHDPHPADILRGYLSSETVRLLLFSAADDWGDVLEAETDKDVTAIELAGTAITLEEAKHSAKIVASALVQTKLNSLEHHALGDIQNWRNRDERIVKQLRFLLTATGPLSDHCASGMYAAHVVAAAVTESVSSEADISCIFERMVTILKTMHDANPSWGPLYLSHPGDIVAHCIYVPSTEETLLRS
jgi:hypothetical protein